MSSALFVILGTVALIALSAFFVIIEFALLGARRHRLEAEAPNSRAARSALRGMNELTLMLAGAQLGITACTFALGAVTKPALDYWLRPLLVTLGVPEWVAGGSSFAMSLLVVTFLHLVVGEMAPKSWAIAHPETAAKLVCPAGRAFVWIVRPLLVGINKLANRLVRASGVIPVERAAVGGRDAQTIQHLVEQSAQKGALDSTFQAQISEVLELELLTVGDLLAEHGKPVAVDVGATVRDVQNAAARSGHLRILLSTPGGGLPGVVHVRDTLPETPQRPVLDLARAPFVLTTATPVYEALARMRAQGEHLAVVTAGDEVTGVLSVSDILRRVLPSTKKLGSQE